jgi:hypothetical protein
MSSRMLGFYGSNHLQNAIKNDSFHLHEKSNRTLSPRSVNYSHSSCGGSSSYTDSESNWSQDLADMDDGYGLYDDMGPEVPTSNYLPEEETSTNFSGKASNGDLSSIDKDEFDYMGSTFPTATLNGIVTSSSSSSNCTSSSSSNSNNNTGDSSVICLIEDSKAPLVCRSFDTRTTVCLSLGGLRIIHRHHFLEEAEYKITLKINNKVYTSWKTYEEFRCLGQACMAYYQHRSTQQLHEMMTTSTLMTQTIDAWKIVENHRPWWFKPSGLKYFLEESMLLETFMKHLLFEVPCIQMILEFMQ